MNLGRIFANAVARRIAFVLVAGIFAFVASCFVPQAAHAASYPTQGEAYVGCVTHGTGAVAARDASNAPAKFAYRCIRHPTNPNDRTFYCEIQQTTPVAGNWAGCHNVPPYEHFHIYPAGTECAARPNPDGEQNWNASIWGNLSTVCDAGCEIALTDTACTIVSEGPNPGQWCNAIRRPTGGTCTQDDEPPDDGDPDDCEQGEVQLPDGTCGEQGECPVGQHEVDGECHPTGECGTGQVKGPDGSCNDEGCPAGQAKGEDGSCKPDEDGDGEPDEGEDDGTFSGGEDCRTPPQCSGDNILCGQARIQWRIDCNTRKNLTVTGGNGCGPGSAPICTGEKCDPVEVSQLLQAHATKCAVEALAGDGEEPGGGGNSDLIEYMTAERQAEKNALDADAAQGDGLAGVEEGSMWGTFDNSDFNPDLFGGGSPASCTFQQIHLMGHEIPIAPELWTMFQWIGWLTVASAYIWVAMKLGS